MTARPTLVRQWDDNCEALASYVQEHGKLPARYGELGKLYEWTTQQRYKHRKGTLLPERAERLAAIPGILFEKRPDRVGELAQFHADHGRLPKIKAADPAEHSLAVYLVHGLRRLVVNGTISADMLARAKAIPGAVEVRRRPDQDKRLEELRSFVAENGYMPRNLEGEVVLRDWVRNVTAGTPATKSAVLRERHLAVAEIAAGTPSYAEYSWRKHLNELEEFCSEHGHLPGRTHPDSEALRNWLRKQMAPLNTGSFDEVSSRRLRNVLDYPSAQDYAWKAKLVELKDFVDMHGRLPRGFYEGDYSWLSRQRRDHRKGLLTSDRVEALAQIDGVLPAPSTEKAAA